MLQAVAVAAGMGSEDAWKRLQELVRETASEDRSEAPEMNEHELARFFGKSVEEIRRHLARGWRPPRIVETRR